MTSRRSHAGQKTAHVSPSQIATFRDCERKWSYQYVDGLRGPPNRHAQLGTDVHAVLERWFKHGTAPDLNLTIGEIAVSGLRHHPAPSKDLRVEHEARFEFEGVHYLGYIDLHYQESKHIICVTDHKTTTDFRWALDEDALVTDAQRIIYSVWSLIAYGVRQVRAKWVYYRTTPPPKSHVVELVQSADEIWEAFRDVHADAQAIVRARRRSTADAPRNFNACQAYGGCPFVERCHNGVSAIDKAKSIFAQAERAEEVRRGPVPPLDRGRARLVVLPGGQEPAVRENKRKTMGLLDRVKNGLGKANGASPGASPTFVDDEPEAEAPVAGSSFLANLQKRIAENKAGKTEPDLPFEDEVPTAEQRAAVEAEDAAKAEKEKTKTTRTRKMTATTTVAAVAPRLGIDLENPKHVRVIFHLVGIYSGEGPDVAEAHYKAIFAPSAEG